MVRATSKRKATENVLTSEYRSEMQFQMQCSSCNVGVRGRNDGASSKTALRKLLETVVLQER